MATSTLSTLRARREQIVRGHVDAESNHDVAGVLASFHQPCYDVVPLGVVSDGAAAVEELLTGLLAGFPDFKAEILTMHHADTAVILEARMTGTQNGPWAGIEPTGRSMDLRLAAIFEFDEDRLMCEKVYFDFATLLRQLGKLG
jgi:steroid delta-isomerase-like uncharacterized protein